MNALKVNADQMFQYSSPTPIPQGQVEFSKVQFLFSKDWDRFDQKIAQFVQGDVIYNKAIIHGACTVPSELQLGSFTVFVKGYGTDGAAIATANGVTMSVVPGGKTGGTPPLPPEPDLYSLLLQAIKDGDEALQNEIDSLFIPTELSQLEEDAEHRTVSDEEKEKWNCQSGSAGGSVDPETIQQIVEDYLASNPPADGFSPSVRVNQTETGAAITVVDRSGQTQATIKNGKDGVGVRTISGNADGSWTITYTDENTETISNEAYTALKTLIDSKQPLGDYLTSVHNTSPDSHNDIRDLITGLTSRLNVLLDSDDTSLDQLSEIVAYIKSNKSLIEQVTTNKVNVSDIANNLTTNDTNKPLSAAMGVELKKLVDAIKGTGGGGSGGGWEVLPPQQFSDVSVAEYTIPANVKEIKVIFRVLEIKKASGGEAISAPVYFWVNGQNSYIKTGSSVKEHAFEVYVNKRYEKNVTSVSLVQPVFATPNYAGDNIKSIGVYCGSANVMSGEYQVLYQE